MVPSPFMVAEGLATGGGLKPASTVAEVHRLIELRCRFQRGAAKTNMGAHGGPPLTGHVMQLLAHDFGASGVYRSTAVCGTPRRAS
jgi:hypothetical protein